MLNNKMEKLKSCPFCGGEASFVNCELPPQWFVRCAKGCCEQSRLYMNKASAKAAWNRRKKGVTDETD